MKDKDQEKLWEAYITEAFPRDPSSRGPNDPYGSSRDEQEWDEPHPDAESKEIKAQLGPEEDEGAILAQAAAQLGESEGLVYIEGGAVVQRKSPISGELNKIFIRGLTQEQYDEWRKNLVKAQAWKPGMPRVPTIQTTLGHIDADNREFLKTGITPEEWDKIFGGGGE